jgi:hypothetical protein
MVDANSSWAPYDMPSLPRQSYHSDTIAG